MKTRGQRLMHSGYAAILGRLSAGDCTKAEITEAVGITDTRANSTMHWLEHFGLCHVVEWRRVQHGYVSSLRPVWRLGEGENVPMPGRIDGLARKYTRPAHPKGRLPSELLSFTVAIKALQADSHNALSLAQEVGINHNTARGIIKHLYKQKLIYVDGWVISIYGSLGANLYHWGPGVRDKQKPRPLSQIELWRRKNDRLRVLRQQMRILGIDEKRAA